MGNLKAYRASEIKFNYDPITDDIEVSFLVPELIISSNKTDFEKFEIIEENKKNSELVISAVDAALSELMFMPVDKTTEQVAKTNLLKAYKELEYNDVFIKIIMHDGQRIDADYYFQTYDKDFAEKYKILFQ